MTSVLAGGSTLVDSLVTAPKFEGDLALLPRKRGPRAPTWSHCRRRSGCWPKRTAGGHRRDRLAAAGDRRRRPPLPGAVDDVMLTVKLGTSRMDRVQELAKILADSGIGPAGAALIGLPARPDTYNSEAAKQRPPAALSAIHSRATDPRKARWL
ncbi:MAG: hypothetical protein GEU88_15540 [Solirubrobacterales bacterium]|nr:hypothetical protein [Solirubrobacterales bacterium]